MSAPSLLVVGIVLMVIGLAMELFRQWQKNPMRFQQRTGSIVKPIFRIIAAPFRLILIKSI